MTRQLLFGLAFLAQHLLVFAQIEAVTIGNVIPSDGHRCVSYCLYSTFRADMGSALQCGTPYDNRCYCGTEAADATAASRHISSCISASCEAGDYERDLTSAHSLYADYCMAAGFTQPGATEWVNAEPTRDPSSEDEDTETPPPDTTDPAPNPTRDSLPPQTTTEVSVVTETVDSPADSSSRDVVTHHATSTVWINSDGTRATGAPEQSSDGDDGSAWRIGVGVAVPVVALLVIVLVWWFYFRRPVRKPASENPPVEYSQPSPPDYSQEKPGAVSPPIVSTTPVSRKAAHSLAVSALSSPNEVVGDTPGPRRELHAHSTQQTSSLEVVTSHAVSPVSSGPHHHEVQGESRWTEMSGQGRPPELWSPQRSFPTDHDGNPRMELPGHNV